MANNLQINNIIQSRRTMRGTKDANYLECVLNQIQNRPSFLQDEQYLLKKYSNISIDLQQRFSKFSLRGSQKNLRLINPQQTVQSNNVENSSLLLEQIMDENIQRNGKKQMIQQNLLIKSEQIWSIKIMQQMNCELYNNNYRNRIQIYEEEHKLFQNMPNKCDDSVVEQEPISQLSRFEQNRYEEIQINEQKVKANFEDNQKNEQNKQNQITGRKLNYRNQKTQRTRQKSSPNYINNVITQYQEQSLANTINMDDEEEEQKAQPIKLIKALKLLVNIQHFYRLLTSNVRVLNRLTHIQHQLIGDISSFYSKSYQKDQEKYYFIIGRLWGNLSQKFENVYIPVFQPQSKLIKTWDSILMLLIMFFTLLLKLELFFGMNITKFYLLYNILLVFSIIDIFVELNTGVVQKGNVINDKKFIFKSYIKNILFFDFFGNLSIIVIIFNFESSDYLKLLINFLFLFKWVKITKILKEVTYYYSYEKNHKNLVDLLKLLFFVIGICHIFCLFWHGLGQLSINRGDNRNWIQSKNLLDASTFQRYIYSFYFLAVTMATVGYGDVTPQNNIEVLFTTITIFVTCIVYAFSINTIGSIIENIEKKDKKYKENLQIIHGVMREENVSRELKIKISNCIKYPYKGKYLNDILLFKNIKQKDKVTSIMEDNKNREDLVLSHKGKSEYFGEHYFINEIPRSLSTKASDFCRIYKVSRQGFQKVINQYDYDFKNFQVTQEAIQFNNNYKLCSFTCSICNSPNHISINCPKTHLVLSKQVVISRYNKWNLRVLQVAIEEINCHESLFDILDQLEVGLDISLLHDIDSYQESQSMSESNSLAKLEERVETQRIINSNQYEMTNQESSQMNFKSQIQQESDSLKKKDTLKLASNLIASNKEKTSSSILQKSIDQNFSQQQKTKKQFQPTQLSFSNSEYEIKQNEFSSCQSLDSYTVTSFSNKGDQTNKDYDQLKQLKIQLETGQRQIDEYKQKRKSKLAQEAEMFEEKNKLDQKQMLNQLLLSEQIEQPNLQIIRCRNSFKNVQNQPNQEHVKENLNTQNPQKRESIFGDYFFREKLFPSQQTNNSLNLRERRRINQIELVQNSIHTFINQHIQKQLLGNKILMDENILDSKKKKKFSFKSYQNNVNFDNLSKKQKCQIEQILTNEHLSSLQTATEKGIDFERKIISTLEEKIHEVIEPPDQQKYWSIGYFQSNIIFIKATNYTKIMDLSTSNYNNNQTYRCQIPFIEEDHRVIQNFPFKSNDSVVEPELFSQYSRRQLSVNRDFNSNYKNQNEFEKSDFTISRQNSRRSFQQDTSQQQMNTPVKSIFRAALTRNISQLMDQSIIQSVNNMEDIESKVFPIKLVRVLKLLVNVQHFYRMLTKNTRIFNKITQKQHDLVGDIVSVYSKNKKNVEALDKRKFIQLIFNLFYHLNLLYQLIKIPFFTPSGMLIRIWDTFLAILILFSTFLLNLQLFFTMQIQEFKVLFQILFILSIVDILMELNTGILKKGNITYNRQFIIKSYIKSNLIFDILGNMPLFVFVFNIEVTTNLQVMINILFLFKWSKIFKILKWLTFYVSYEKNNKNAFDLFRLLFFVIGICHIFCLFWHGLGLYEINSGYTNSWIASKNLLDADIFERYVYSFYFLAVTMVTVGYGDITPQNSIEVVFTTITIFVTCIVYAFSLNTIGSIIENIEKKDKKYKENMQVIHGLMREENVSRDLRIKVSNYVEYLYKESNEVLKKQEKLIINKLSQKLRNDLSLEIQGKYLNTIPLFKNIKVKDKISNLMEEHLYSPGEIIFKQGDQDDCSLFYIVKGKVSIIFISDSENSQRDDLIISCKGKHEYFGEISFISGNQRTLTAKASDFCRIYKINRDKCIQIIKENDQDFENFQMIKEAISLNNNYKFCSIFCSICQSGNHFSQECPKTHLTLTKQVVISRYNSCIPQTERAEFDRKRRKFNTFSQCILLRKAIAEINQHESLFEILDQIEFDCNLGDIFDFEEMSECERDNTSKIQRLRTQESQKKGNNSPNQNQINQEETANISNDIQKANRMRIQLQNTGSTNSLSPRSSEFNKYPQQMPQSKKSQMCVSNLDEPKLSASELKSSDSDTSSNSSSSSDSSKGSRSSSKSSNRQSYQENLQLKSPENRITNKSEQDFKKHSNGFSPSKQKQNSNEKGLDQQQNTNFNYQSINKLSSISLQSKIQIEQTDKVDEKNAIEQKLPNKNPDKNETNQHVSNNHSLNSFSLICSNINNEPNQNQHQTQQINDQKPQSLTQFKTLNARLSSKNRQQYQQQQQQQQQHPQEKRTIRESRIINSYEIIQQSIQAFMNQQQRNKRQITFHDEKDNSHKKQQQQTYQQQNQYTKGLSNQDKRQSSHKNHMTSIFCPPQLLLDDNIQKLEQKLQEFTEPPDLVNYQMFQTFDKAKIYKFYLPNFNYPEIVQKWIQYQKKLQLKHKLTSRSYQKKKQPRVQTKRKITQNIQNMQSSIFLIQHQN
ncbi:hypothetical protein ABPG72_012223 [Tetrahymena utriculariae]